MYTLYIYTKHPNTVYIYNTVYSIIKIKIYDIYIYIYIYRESYLNHLMRVKLPCPLILNAFES